MNWVRFYEDRYSAKTVQNIVRSKSVKKAEHARIEARISRVFDIPDNAAILDVGGGPATYFSSFDTITTDLSINALRMSHRTRLVQCDATNLPFLTESFDVVVCSQVLEHVPDWKSALGEIVRVAKVGAAIYIAVPNRYSLMKRRYHSLQRKFDSSGHIHEFREYQLVFALRDLGVVNISTSGACYDLFWIFSALERTDVAHLAVPILDKINSRILSTLFAEETKLHRNSLSGFSLELFGTKQ